MSNDIIQMQPVKPLSLVSDKDATLAHIRAIKEITSKVMKEGVHYGTIPGCDQPSLYKPGSELLLATFKISVEPEVKEIRDGNHITYQVRCFGRHMTTNIIIGVGVGECSTAEDKYSWRSAVCDEEFEQTPDDKRRVKWNKGRYDRNTGTNAPAYSVKQVRTNPADLANTCLKMAKKRAQIDLCLTGLSASDVFTQDIEDLPDGYIDDGSQRQSPNRYKEKDKAGAPEATPAQLSLIRKRLEINGKTEAQLLEHFKLDAIEKIQKSQVNTILDWANAKAGDQ